MQHSSVQQAGKMLKLRLMFWQEGGHEGDWGDKQLFAWILSKLRQLMICRMAKPEEVRGVLVPGGVLVWAVCSRRGGGHVEAGTGVLAEGWVCVMRLKTCNELMIADVVGCLQVIVVEDENGNIVRETMKDNDVLQQYKTMRETLVGAAKVVLRQ